MYILHYFVHIGAACERYTNALLKMFRVHGEAVVAALRLEPTIVRGTDSLWLVRPCANQRALHRHPDVLLQ
jgi:hypothetical protein